MNKEDKKKMRARQIYISDEAWLSAKEMLKGTRISRSVFIEITFRNMAKINNSPVESIYQGVIDDLFNVAKAGVKKDVNGVLEKLKKEKVSKKAVKEKVKNKKKE